MMLLSSRPSSRCSTLLRTKLSQMDDQRLHIKKLQHAFRFYSHRWRTWSACFIQVAWRHYTKQKLAKELTLQEYMYCEEVIEDELGDEHDGTPLLHWYCDGGEPPAREAESGGNFQHLGVTILASKFSKNTKKGANQKVSRQLSQATAAAAVAGIKLPKLLKPDEPDFSLH